MTIVEAMECLRDLLEQDLTEYRSQGREELLPIHVYAGFPPQRKSPGELGSYIYCQAMSWEDNLLDRLSRVTIMLGFVVRDEDTDDGDKALFNLMEHVRQCLLVHRIIDSRISLVLPLKGDVPIQQPYPHWVGTMQATYTIAQPEAGGIDFNDF